MENKFITVRTDRGIYVHINTNHIQVIESNNHGCYIWIINSSGPYTVNVSADEIIKKINQK